MYEHGAAGTHKYAYDPTGVHMMDNDTYLKDGHGNVTGMYDENGEYMSDTYYDAFGNVAYGDTPNPFGYSGEYLDDETGLIYLRNRYYDSSTGRFITEDPAKDGTNWYSYCAGDPVNAVDPWGLKAGDEFDSVEEVLQDAYFCYYGLTDFTQLEQGSAIYEYSVVDEQSGETLTKYSYTDPFLGSHVDVELEDRAT